MLLEQQPKRRKNERHDSVEHIDWIDTDASEDEDYLPQFPYQPPFPVAPSIKDYFLKQPYTISGSSISDCDSISSIGDDEEYVEEEEPDNRRISSLDVDDFQELEILSETDQPVTTSTKPSHSRRQRARERSGSSSSSSRARRTSSSDNSNQNRTARINSASWDINTRELYRQKFGIRKETPSDKVRKAIDATVDNGIELVDLSNIGLIEIPDEVRELEYVTIVQNDMVKPASIQLYLYNNNLISINPTLFKLKNLTVLSLRNNNLEYLSPDIALLTNLVELSLGNNQLTFIPSELLHLKKLAILSLSPNPFLPMPAATDGEQPSRTIARRWRAKQTFASLFETCTRAIFNDPEQLNSVFASSSIYSQIIPNDILHRIQSVSVTTNHACEHCKALFLTPDVEELVWHSRILGNHNIPILYRFCSISCYQRYSFSVLPNDTDATPAETSQV